MLRNKSNQKEQIKIRINFLCTSLIISINIISMIHETSLPKNAQFFENSQWEEVRHSLIKHYIQPQKMNIVSDQQLIQKQSDLMEQIKQKLHRSRFKQPFGSMEILPIDSSLSNISSAYNYGDEQSLIKSKFTEQFQSSLVNSALKQVRANCSEQTYETVRNYVINNKQKQCENLLKALDKKNKQMEELQLNVILKQNQIVKLKQQLSPYVEKMETLQSEKKRWKQKNDQIMEKEKRIHKTQMALIFKEKMHQQVKKRSQRLKQFTDSIHTKMRNIEKELNTAWSNILKEMQKHQSSQCCSQPDPKGCWKKDLMKKCREKLLQERNLLKQEQKQLQKQYEVMENISQQCKKLVSQSQQGLTGSHINSGGNSAIILGAQEKTAKINSFSLIQTQAKRV